MNPAINALVQTLVAALGGAAASWQADPLRPWQVHAAAGAVTGAAYLTGKMQQPPGKKGLGDPDAVSVGQRPDGP